MFRKLNSPLLIMYKSHRFVSILMQLQRILAIMTVFVTKDFAVNSNFLL